LESRLQQERQGHAEAAEAAAVALRDLQAQVAAEREGWRKQLEGAEQQLAEEREAVRAAFRRLEQEAAALRGVRDELSARNTEHGAVLQRLQEVHDEIARSQDKASGLQAELEQLRERQREVEILKQQLSNVRVERDQLCARVPELEGRANSADRLWPRLRAAGAETERLRVQLRAAESQTVELETMRAECDRLREQVQALETQRQATETSALALEAVRAERDHWQAETRALQAGFAAALAERECALTKIAEAQETALATARADWESERQAHAEAAQASEAASRAVQAEITAERERWRKQLEGAELQLVWERGMSQERGEQMQQQVAMLQAERDRLAARLAQTELPPQGTEDRSRDAAVSAAELSRQRQQAAHEQVFAEISVIQQIRQRQQSLGQQRPAAVPNSPSRVGEQVFQVSPGGGVKTSEQPSVPSSVPAIPADAAEASVRSDPPHDSAALSGTSQPAEDGPGLLSERKKTLQEKHQWLWQKFLHFTLGK
jgi:chromosome segregation ATPase